MSRALGLLAALVVMAATLLVARPAEAAGDTYTWVATGAGNFSDPLNWTRASDGAHAVPGPSDAAVIVDPPGTVTIAQNATVDSLTVDADEDGAVDLRINEQRGLSATSVVLSGDTDIEGRVITADLRVSGSVSGSDGSVHLVPIGVPGPDNIAHLVLDGVTWPTIQVLDSSTQVEVAGTEPSAVDAIFVLGEASVALANDSGATFVGRVLVDGGHVGIDGDIPADAIVSAGYGLHGGGDIAWTDTSATIDGFLAVSPSTRLSLPDDLTVNGSLGIDGQATGGSVTLGANGAFRFIDQGQESHGQPNLDLTGTLASDQAGAIFIESTDAACVGDEDLLVRARGGVSFPSGTIGNDGTNALTIDGVSLGHELVGVYRGSSNPPGCSDSRSTRIVRSMYRDLLGRRADAGGAAYWSSKVEASPAAVASSLLGTSEARASLVRSTWDVWSCDGVPPTDEQVADGVAFLASGGTVGDLRGDVLASTVPDDGDPVTCLYHAVLGREPDAGGRAYAEGRLEHESLQRVARRYMVTSEGRRVQFNRLYRRLLGRDATADEVADGTRQMRSGRHEAWVTAQIAGSDEYATRATG